MQTAKVVENFNQSNPRTDIPKGANGPTTIPGDPSPRIEVPATQKFIENNPTAAADLDHWKSYGAAVETRVTGINLEVTEHTQKIGDLRADMYAQGIAEGQTKLVMVDGKQVRQDISKPWTDLIAVEKTKIKRLQGIRADIPMNRDKYVVTPFVLANANIVFQSVPRDVYENDKPLEFWIGKFAKKRKELIAATQSFVSNDEAKARVVANYEAARERGRIDFRRVWASGHKDRNDNWRPPFDTSLEFPRELVFAQGVEVKSPISVEPIDTFAIMCALDVDGKFLAALTQAAEKWADERNIARMSSDERTEVLARLKNEAIQLARFGEAAARP
jgi:hypothetical protein